VTLVEGAPGRLPGVALGSVVLLHVERAGALFAVAVAIVSVLTQAARGRLPTQLTTGGLAYGPEDFAADTASSVVEIQRQVDDLESTLVALTERLDASEGQV
jgi:hypothetical protein